MAVTSRQGLIDYCLRELGHPVVEINVDDDQVSDRIDEAFQYYQDYHYDAVERVYLKHLVTSSNQTNAYIDLDDSIIGVVRILPFSAINTGQAYMWDIRYQLRLNDMFDLLNTSIIYYQQVKQQLALIDHLLVGSKSFRFQRHMNRLYIDMGWTTDITEGEYIIVEAYKILDPNAYTDVYGDRFLKRYATALIKRQWGTNLKKFEGIQMPGGVTLNGQKIYDEAMEEIKYLETEMQSSYVEPPNFMMG